MWCRSSPPKLFCEGSSHKNLGRKIALENAGGLYGTCVSFGRYNSNLVFSGEGMLGAKIVVKHVCQYDSSLVVVAACFAGGLWLLVFGLCVCWWCWCFGASVTVVGGGSNGGSWVGGWCGPKSDKNYLH